MLADPDWPNKVRAGQLEDIRPCLGDHECLQRIISRKYLSCTVNPQVGMKGEFTLAPAEKRKKVLVVGGGPGGKKSALAADSVVLALGVQCNNGLYEALMNRVPEVYAIGDCVEPGKVINAIWGGFRTARLI